MNDLLDTAEISALVGDTLYTDLDRLAAELSKRGYAGVIEVDFTQSISRSVADVDGSGYWVTSYLFRFMLVMPASRTAVRCHAGCANSARDRRIEIDLQDSVNAAFEVTNDFYNPMIAELQTGPTRSTDPTRAEAEIVCPQLLRGGVEVVAYYHSIHKPKHTESMRAIIPRREQPPLSDRAQDGL